jgi:Uma2 family endonuclease
MALILDDPSIRKAAFPLTVEFYHAATDLGLINEDVELLEGTLVRKMAKSPLHQWLIRLLFRLLDRHLPAGLCVLVESPLTFAQSEPEPDLAVVRGSEQDFRNSHPSSAELVIEVAVSSAEIDRRKADIYAAGGVKEYWVILPEQKTVEVYRNPTPTGGYAERLTVKAPGHLASSVIPGIETELGQLFDEQPRSNI